GGGGGGPAAPGLGGGGAPPAGATRPRRSRPGRRAGRPAEPARRSSPARLTPAEKRSQRAQPIALGRQGDMADAEGRERGHEIAALILGRSGEPLSQPRVPRIDAKLAATLGVDQPELPHVGKLLFTRIAHLDGKHGVPTREPQQGWKI